MKAPTVLHLFSGSGGGALGFRRAGFRGVGAIDIDQAACRDLERLTGEQAHVADIGAMETPADLAALCPESPDVVFTSPPCKGFSGCLPEASAKGEKYQQLNSLAFHGLWLALEAWRRRPRLVLLENVPRIQSRGRVWLERMVALLHKYGYAVDTSVHDCGVLGGLAQRRRRFLLVARHMPQVEAYLRLPTEQRVRSIGEVLGELPVPVPGSTGGGPMHALPRLSALNWVRLALIPAGSDWRAIPDAVRVAERSGRPNGPYGVEEWSGPSHAVLGHTKYSNTWGSVSDPRVGCRRRDGGHGVRPWDGQSAAVIGHPSIDNFPAQVADPRLSYQTHRGCVGVMPWGTTAPTIRGAHNVNNAKATVADPRIRCEQRSGAYGVQDWARESSTVLATGTHDNAPGSLADPRFAEPTHHVDAGGDLPMVVGPELDLEVKRPTHLVIAAADGTWHRPLTTLELAALQGFPTQLDGAPLELDGRAHAGWRERIGNAVPPPTAYAIAMSCAATIAAAAAGRWTLDGNPIWVREQLRRRDGLAWSEVSA